MDGADVIPTIEDIVDGLLSGKFTREQAIKWLNQHAEYDA
jgi:hypothetical protein